VYLVDGRGEQHISARGKTGFPFFGQLVLDCLNRTEHAMTQEHAFEAIELALIAQAGALRIGEVSLASQAGSAVRNGVV
jgi:hypothetical protein